MLRLLTAEVNIFSKRFSQLYFLREIKARVRILGICLNNRYMEIRL